MIYQVGNMCVLHPVTGDVVMPGGSFECRPAQLRERWTDPDWLARAGIPWIVRELKPGKSSTRARKPRTEAKRTSTAPADVVETPAQAPTPEPPAEAAAAVVLTPDQLAGLSARELKAVADDLGVAYGSRPSAASLRSRILKFQG